jgi:hypothetical protein
MKRRRAPIPALARRRALRLATGLALVATLAPLAAQPAGSADAPAARLRFRLERDARRLQVGEAIVVRLEVWVSTWFQAPVEFPSTLDADGALVEAVAGSPDSRFEDFGGRRWTGLIRRYRVLPVQPGAVSVALAAPMQVQPGGAGARPLRLAPPAPLRLTVLVPPGGEDIQPFVAARRLELRQTWWPQDRAGAAAPQVGDLVRREIVLVTDSTSPLLPAPDFGAPPGVAVRVQAAQLQEQRANAAATPTLTRRHECVYTLQQAGRIELPPVDLVWWDLRTRRRRLTRLDGLTLDVKPAAKLADPFAMAPLSPAPESARESLSGRIATAAVLSALLAASALAAGIALTSRRVAGRTASESGRQAWQRLRQACRQGDAMLAHAALGEVVASLDIGTRQRWQRDAGFASAWTELGRHRFGPSAALRTAASHWSGQALWQAASRLRRQARLAPARRALPTLHP